MAKLDPVPGSHKVLIIEEETRVDQWIYFCQLIKLHDSIPSFMHERGLPHR